MKRFTFVNVVCGVFFAMLAGMSHGTDFDELNAKRAEIATARLAAEADWAEQDKACKQRFVVTSCLENAQASRDLKLRELRKKELEINEAERQLKALKAKEKLEQRQAEQALRLEKAVQSDKPNAFDQQDGASPDPAHHNGRGAREAKVVSRPSEAQQQQRMQERQERLQEAEQHRQEVRNRYPQSPAKPLPMPQASDFSK